MFFNDRKVIVACFNIVVTISLQIISKNLSKLFIDNLGGSVKY